MDKPPPDDLDPYSLIEDPSEGGNDNGNDNNQGHYHGAQNHAAQHRPKCPGRCPAPKVSKLPHENSMYQRLIDFCCSLLTPPRNASPEELRRHAISMSIAVGLTYAHIAIACGWASSIGLSGFARADTVTTVQAEVMDVRLTLYGVAIRDLHRSYCNAVNYEDSLALNDQMQAMQLKYQKATGVPYLLPACPHR